MLKITQGDGAGLDLESRFFCSRISRRSEFPCRGISRLSQQLKLSPHPSACQGGDAPCTQQRLLHYWPSSPRASWKAPALPCPPPPQPPSRSPPWLITSPMAGHQLETGHVAERDSVIWFHPMIVQGSRGTREGHGGSGEVSLWSPAALCEWEEEISKLWPCFPICKAGSQ